MSVEGRDRTVVLLLKRRRPASQGTHSSLRVRFPTPGAIFLHLRGRLGGRVAHRLSSQGRGVPCRRGGEVQIVVGAY
jgi:hypothetical protein